MIRKATLQDIKAIYGLLQYYGTKGDLLPRPYSELYDHLRDFSVYEDSISHEIVGCCALQFCWSDLAEIRSLAVSPDHLRKKIGSQLAEYALTEARQYQITQVFTLTYRPDFFDTLGFERIDRAALPLKIWSGCLFCVKFPDCDETAMMKRLCYTPTNPES
ncbi:MAG: N-acetyltransferase [Desulfatirhabdiaceae bacterium]|jgi:amino-acid N-acetyltransferase